MRQFLGRVPWFAIVGVAVVLVAAIVGLGLFKMIKPKQAELAEWQQKRDTELQEAGRRDAVEAKLAGVQAEWEEAQVRIQELRDSRSFPISDYQPLGAMIALWYEYSKDLPRVTKEWIDSTGVTLNSSVTFPQPEMSPPTVPDDGFIALPGPISLSIDGNLAQIEGFYASLRSYPRVICISGLNLSGEGDELSATVPVSIYLLVEKPAAAPAPAAAPDGAGGGMPGAPGPPVGPGGPGDEGDAGGEDEGGEME
jgi:Tfp pilus assembly protein PilO